MRIIMLLEQLATTVHHKIELDTFLKDESSTIQKAFSYNDATYLKSNLNGDITLADRTTIFEI
ncbi:hypothetical protein LEAN103870_04895 [Legionella anisa]|uniref:Uncharacterized protein n=1 Tax=Legionella anisa TaxID=28082 RepID=A0AAX0WT25_9GAMM|nr:hypothetical protein [Legionella anisa]AWN73111.1 hypothetical protein DLD14_04255 [Legionella anisa]KTC67454.1 hypothetical protein Lani_3799 [Legionella anisa]MCW8423941.1 hypothetical protein [Legionella anisa]MCW8447463.1 hypothetical protein [Legionella anisa]PNL60229.1 hypothetical protein A6J39_002845 [Legionella anisa]